jgi:hypothetical protein
MTVSAVLDAAGRRRSPATMPGYPPESSPGTWCKTRRSRSSVNAVGGSGRDEFDLLVLIEREISFSDTRSLRVAIDFWLM